MEADKMLKLDIEQYRADCQKSIQYNRPLYLERPLVFSPAAAVQEDYGTCQLMMKFIGMWIPWQYTHWVEEGISFHETAYIGDWSSLTKFHIKGPDALKFLSWVCTNDFSKFEIGQIKHAVQTNDLGKVAGEGILFRVDDDEYRYTGGGAYWMLNHFKEGNWNAEAKIDTSDIFVFAVQGPKSLHILEKVTGKSLRDIKFNHTRMSRIGGLEVRILRTGITGELGYEIHGPAEYGNYIWKTVLEGGQEFGIKQLGGGAQNISHIEAGFATIIWDFIPSAAATAGRSQVHTLNTSTGSYEAPNLEDLMRSPLELGWEKEVSLDTHEFIGREAIMAEVKAGGPARQLVGLLWNNDDFIDLFAGLFRDEPSPSPVDLPRLTAKRSMHADKVLKDGELIGTTTSLNYSPFLKKMISLCTIDKRFKEPGTEVTVIYGMPGGPQKEIRATVVKLPFKEDKRRIDVSKI